MPPVGRLIVPSIQLCVFDEIPVLVVKSVVVREANLPLDLAKSGRLMTLKALLS